MDVKSLRKKAVQLRIDTLKATHRAGSGFVGGAMSVMEILTTLYYADLNNKPIMRFDPSKPGWDGQDYLVLSKGHAAASWYAILADLGFFDKGEMDYLRKVNAMLQGRPVKKIPGVSVGTAGMARGLSAAVGLATAVKMDRKDNKVFTVIGDSELQAGRTWEAAMAAAYYKLNNLVLFIDNNGQQEGGALRGTMDIYPIQAKFDAFGWQVIQVRDGHDFDQILDALHRGFRSIAKPICVWCHTKKGRGIDFAEGKEGYHGVALSDEEMAELIPKLERQLTEI